MNTTWFAMRPVRPNRSVNSDAQSRPAAERRRSLVAGYVRRYTEKLLQRATAKNTARKLVVAAVACAIAQSGGAAGDAQSEKLVADLQGYSQQIADSARNCLGQTSVPTTSYEIEVHGVWANPPLAGQSMVARVRYTPIGNGAVIVDGQSEENPNIKRTGQQVSVLPGVAVWSVSHVEHVAGPLKGELTDSYSVARDVKCLQPLFPLTVGKEFSVSAVTEYRSSSNVRPEFVGSRQQSWTLKVLAGPMTLDGVLARHGNVTFAGAPSSKWRFYELSSSLQTGAVGQHSTIEGHYLFVEGLNAFVRLWDDHLREGHSTHVVGQ